MILFYSMKTVNELNLESMKVGLKMNMGKTKVICNSFAENNPMARNTELEFVDENKYLATILEKVCDLIPEVTLRIKSG